MSFFISDALAEGGAAASQTGDPITALLFPIGLIALFYFFLNTSAKQACKRTQGNG